MGKFVAGGPNPGRKFQKGQSGNPRGRPRSIIEVAAAAREYSTQAIATLTKIMEDEQATSSARVAAAIALLDRGCGKPAQTLDLVRREIDAREMKVLSDDELLAIIHGSEKPVATTNGGAGDTDAPPDPPVAH